MAARGRAEPLRYPAPMLAEEPSPERHPIRALLGDGTMRCYLASRVSRNLADAMLGAALAWHLFEVSGSATILGVLGIVEFLPVIPLGLLAGAWADRFDRLRIVRGAQVALTGAGFGLAALASGGAPLAGLLALAFVLACAATVERPAGSALLPRLVPPAWFAPAVTLTSSLRNAATALGPLVAGFAIAEIGIGATYAVAAMLFATSVTLLRFIPAPGPAEGGGEPVSLEAIRAGVRFVRNDAAILGAMTLDLFAVLFASVTGILPVFAAEVLDVGPRGYGLLSAALTIGTFLMAGLLLRRPQIERPGRALLGAVAVFGLATLVFSLSTAFALSIGALVVAGMADAVSMVTRETIIQLRTPDAMRGRVSAVNFVFIGASNELGAAESGFLAGVTSARFSALFGALACLAAFAWIGARNAPLREFRPGAVPIAPDAA